MTTTSTPRQYTLGVLNGDGIGPEIVPASVLIADAPRGSSRQSMGLTAAAFTAASTMATEEGTISGPMPSPSRTPSR